LLLDPGLKIAGVTNKGNRTIQEQAKSGLKIAGVTKKGVIASSWFRLRGNPEFLARCNLLLRFVKAQKKTRLLRSFAPRTKEKKFCPS